MKKFRYDIGALRAIAVIAVMLYHFKIPFFSGGFIGVDIFFVISGYLMTMIILSGFEKEKFDLTAFYKRRANRIVPPLVALSIGILILSNIFYLANEIQQNAKNVLVSSLFVSNIYYCLYTNYFDPGSQSNIFLHSWSLSVEWQFYILYPLLLLSLKKVYSTNKFAFKTVFISVTILSFLFCSLYTYYNSSFTFYMIPTRAWEMLLGGVAFLCAKNVENIKIRYKHWIVKGSFFTILLAIYFINDSIIWPSCYTIIPTFATFSIVLLRVNLKWSHNPAIQFIGNTSYELYLWHWPVYVTFKYFELDGSAYIIYMLILTGIIASIAYYAIEKQKNHFSLSWAMVLMIIVLPTAYYCFSSPTNIISSHLSIHNNEIKELDTYIAKYLRGEKIKQFNSCNCFITSDSDYSFYDENKCLKIDIAKKNLILLGDSHSAQYSLSLREQIGEEYNIMEVSFGFAFPFLEPRGRHQSVDLIQKFYRFVDTNYRNIDKVIISVHWLMNSTPELKYSDKEIKENILKILEYFKNKNIDVVILGQTESYNKSFPKILMLKSLYEEEPFETFISQSSIKMNEFLKSFVPKDNYVDLFNLPSIQKYDIENRMPYMIDTNHFTKFGADQIIYYLIKNNKLFLSTR